jgi:hypothetical protein
MEEQRKFHNLRLQFDLIQQQRRAVKISLAVFHEVRKIDYLVPFSELLQKAMATDSIDEIKSIIVEMEAIAKSANVTIPD